MSSQVELCEHHAKDCLQAAEKTEDPLAREMLLRHALEWMRDGLAASNGRRDSRRSLHRTARSWRTSHASTDCRGCSGTGISTLTFL
jgi:hypothetical protein